MQAWKTLLNTQNSQNQVYTTIRLSGLVLSLKPIKCVTKNPLKIIELKLKNIFLIKNKNLSFVCLRWIEIHKFYTSCSPVHYGHYVGGSSGGKYFVRHLFCSHSGTKYIHPQWWHGSFYQHSTHLKWQWLSCVSLGNKTITIFVVNWECLEIKHKLNVNPNLEF